MKYTDPLMIEQDSEKMIRRRRAPSIKGKGIVYFILFLFLWGGLVYGGFYFAKQYFDTTINNIQQTNALNIQDLQDRMESLTNEILALKSQISSTDETLSSSSSIQEQLKQKIDVLDQQLKNLEKSLRVLKEAP